MSDLFFGVTRMETDLRKIEVKIDNQGYPVLVEPCGFVMEEGEKVAAIFVEFNSKNCEVLAIGGDSDGYPNICLGGGIYGDETQKGEITAISFPSFKDWNIWCCEFSRYTLHVCFVKYRDTE